ncbi:MAG: pyridoxamine 5'-phosphate oxidase family protein [Treponema sp.]|jgi:nitroimidazol reductase NimA-like FMN-containing flavoprotein (pyridoxamine 5'-phosphate oxidase superfamily)|nr:pyridoxamine 5'-phosphate oxidase family protein [Treponema sp.]
MYRSIRRQDRQIHRDEALAILRQGFYGILSFMAEDGCPAGIPLNYTVDGSGEAIYFHHAPEGLLPDSLARDPRVCFTVVACAEALPEAFSTAYESVLARGTTVPVAGEEKREALMSLCLKHRPGGDEAAASYVAKGIDGCIVYKITVENLCGKRRKK